MARAGRAFVKAGHAARLLGWGGSRPTYQETEPSYNRLAHLQAKHALGLDPRVDTGSPTRTCAKGESDETDGRAQGREEVSEQRPWPGNRQDAVEQAPAQQHRRGGEARRMGKRLAEADVQVSEPEDRD